MYLLYADESGSITDPKQRYFVLAGVSVFERTTHWIEQSLDRIAGRFTSSDPHEVELHASPMRTGQRFWRNFPEALRVQALQDILSDGIVAYHPRYVRLFAIVLEKEKFCGQDLAQVAFEQLSSRFDQFLGRLYRDRKTPERGLMVFDKSSVEARIQTLAREFKRGGHSYGRTRNYADVPMFVDSKASRLVQLADVVCHAVYRYYEHEDDRLFRIVRQCFDAEGGIQHGLCVRKQVA